MNKRIEWIDIAKGIGIILVVLGHISFTNEQLNVWMYSFHMPLFFMISGYLCKKKKTLFKDIVHKAYTILIPYLTICIILLILKAIYIYVLREKILDISIIKNYFIGVLVQNGLSEKFSTPLWFFGCIFLCNVLLLIFIYITNNKKNRIILLSFLCMIIGIIITKYVYESYIYWKFDIALLMMPFLAIGYYIKENDIITKFSKLTKQDKFYILIFLLIIGLLGTFFNYFMTGIRVDYFHRRLNNVFFTYESGFANCIFIILFSYLLSNSKRLKFSNLKDIGKNSAIFYGLSDVGILFSENIVVTTLEQFIHIKIINLIVTILFSLSIPALFSLILNKVPILIGKKSFNNCNKIKSIKEK